MVAARRLAIESVWKPKDRWRKANDGSWEAKADGRNGEVDGGRRIVDGRRVVNDVW